MQIIDKTQRLSMTKPTVCLILAWAVVIASLLAEIKFGGNWLARSGSMMVLLSVMANYILLQDRDAYHSEKLKQYRAGDQAADFSKIHPSREHQDLESTSQVSVVIGTVIWGYGDLFLLSLGR